MLGEYLLGVSASLAANAVERVLKKKPSIFEERKIRSKIDEIVVGVMEPICSFLANEGLDDTTSIMLIDEAAPYIERILENSDFMATRGLDTEKITKDITNQLFTDQTRQIAREYPTAFDTVLNALVDLAVRIPPTFANWESLAFKINFQQLDDLASTLNAIYADMQAIASKVAPDQALIERIISHRESKSVLKISMHGLRHVATPQTQIDNLFIDPNFTETKNHKKKKSQEKSIIYAGSNELYKVLSGNSHSMIVAPAGAGKSTWAAWYATQLLKSDKKKFPIVILLRKYIKERETPSLVNFFKQAITATFHDAFDNKDVQQWTSEGRIVIILDGLDEVVEDRRDEILEMVDGLIVAYPKLQIILTSRPLTSNHLQLLGDRGWRRIDLNPFDTEQVEAYIERFQKHGPEIQTGVHYQDPRKLAETWLSDSTLGPLTSNPLLLSTLLIVHHMDGELPNDRSQLYERYVDGMLGMWEMEKELIPHSAPLSKEQKKKILELIAVNMIAVESDAATESEAVNWLEGYLQDQKIASSVQDVLHHLCERSGLLVGPGQFTFAHKSIGEYLVAQACVDGIQRSYDGTRFDRMLLKQHCKTDRWTTVTFLWTGLAASSDVQQFIDTLIESNDINLAGGLVLENRRKLDREWLESVMWKIIDQGCQSDGVFWNPTSSHIILGHPLRSLSVEREHCSLHEFVGISGRHAHEYELVGIFLYEELCGGSNWKILSNSMTVPIWWAIARKCAYNDSLFNAAPACLSSDQRYHAFCDGLFGQRDLYKSLQEIPDFLLPHVYFMLLYRFIDLVSSALHRGEVLMLDRLRTYFESVENKSLFSEIINSNLEQIPRRFYELLDETVNLDSGFYSEISSVGENEESLKRKSNKSLSFRNICKRVNESFVLETDIAEHQMVKFINRVVEHK